MNSCDTFALSAGAFAGRANILCKNSDRPLGEAQPLKCYPRFEYDKGTYLRCTHLTIPQAEKTWAVIGTQPYWIWGFEAGVNEWGLAIGNEAQGSRCEAETEYGLLGMDMLRLALERAKTAREAITVITELLEKYGQNANASMLFDRRYENSFLLSDPEEIWLLETAGRQWAAKKIEDRYAISNCYTIGSEYDLCSENLEKYARDRRYIAPDEKFDFTKAYTCPAPRQTGSVPRWRRLWSLMGEGVLDEENIKSVLRDHFDGEIIRPRCGAAFGGFMTICMHAMTWDASQTTCSFLSHYDETLGVTVRYAAGIPCCSVYLPVYMTGTLPKIMKSGGEMFDPDSLWWRCEQLAMAVSADEERFGGKVRTSLSALEKEICTMTKEKEDEAKLLIKAGEKEKAHNILNLLTETAAEKTFELVKELSSEIIEKINSLGGLYGPRKEFLENYKARTGLEI